MAILNAVVIATSAQLGFTRSSPVNNRVWMDKPPEMLFDESSNHPRLASRWLILGSQMHVVWAREQCRMLAIALTGMDRGVSDICRRTKARRIGGPLAACLTVLRRGRLLLQGGWPALLISHR
jgi:hypothetical protein